MCICYKLQISFDTNTKNDTDKGCHQLPQKQQALAGEFGSNKPDQQQSVTHLKQATVSGTFCMFWKRDRFLYQSFRLHSWIKAKSIPKCASLEQEVH